MKTLGRITVTLVILLVLYVVGYWFLIREGWAAEQVIHSHNSPAKEKVFSALNDAFHPLKELDLIWNVDIPTCKYLTGHWRSDDGSDFVTIGPHQECHFQLHEFSSKGKATYDRLQNGFIMEFPHQGHMHFIKLSLEIDPNPGAISERVFGAVGITFFDPFERKTDFSTNLTKQAPSAPAP